MSGAITITQKIKYSLGFATPLNKQVTLMRVFFPETGEEDSTKCQAISTFVRRHISRDLKIPISSFSTFHCKKSCEGNSEASFVVQIFFRRSMLDDDTINDMISLFTEVQSRN